MDGKMKKDLKEKTERIFKREKFSKIILYKNPNEFSHVYIERVNPDHIGILWGKRKKSLNKGTHYIRWGKVFFNAIPTIFGLSVIGWLDMFTNNMYHLLLSVGLIGCLCIGSIGFLMYYIPIRLGDPKCLTS